MGGPLKPDDLVEKPLPEGVFTAFNEEISIHIKLKGEVALVPTRNVLLRIMKHMDCSEEEVHQNNWLVQAMQAYNDAGWEVTHHSKPHPFFMFRRAPPKSTITSRQRWEMSRGR